MDSVYLDMITKNLTPEQKMLFTELYGEQKKSTGIAYIFLILLGQVGGQKFYLNHPHKWLYLLFCWTYIPSIVSTLPIEHI